MRSNKNKIVIITGVRGGIGRATAKVFKEENWYVIGIDIKKKANFPFVDEFYSIDISKDEELKKFCVLISKKHNTLNAIINNAAIQIPKAITDLTIEDWDKTFVTNVKPVFLLAKLLYPLLRKGKASIVNISSVHAVATSKNISAYVASKGAVLALTRAMALEFAKDNIRVNTILPGAVDTSMLRAGLNRGHLRGNDLQEQIKELSQRIPLGRIGKAEEIARTISFLADNKRSSFTTGQAIVIDGGAIAKLSTE
ncbi:short-chain dehydrogenase [Parcubacteria bacterium DG_74_2]|nr:MAG: short-chain dehydrogenase [Parcubacteria bacterium DG_74_2]